MIDIDKQIEATKEAALDYYARSERLGYLASLDHQIAGAKRLKETAEALDAAIETLMAAKKLIEDLKVIQSISESTSNKGL